MEVKLVMMIFTKSNTMIFFMYKEKANQSIDLVQEDLELSI
jgi:hypothetical protein